MPSLFWLMEFVYHKKLGMIELTEENRKLFPAKKLKKNDTSKKRPAKQHNGNIDGVIDGSATV